MSQKKQYGGLSMNNITARLKSAGVSNKEIENAKHRKTQHSTRKHKTPTKTGKEIVDLVSKAIGEQKEYFSLLGRLVNHFYKEKENKPKSTENKIQRFHKDIYCHLLKLQVKISKNISTILKDDGVKINYRVILAALISPRKENESNQLKIVRAGIRKNKKISEHISIGRRFVKVIYPGKRVDCGTKLKH